MEILRLLSSLILLFYKYYELYYITIKLIIFKTYIVM
jgi:hypothetical protein